MFCLVFLGWGGTIRKSCLFQGLLFPFQHFVPKGQDSFYVCVVDLNHMCQSGLGLVRCVFLPARWQWLCDAESRAGV